MRHVLLALVPLLLVGCGGFEEPFDLFALDTTYDCEGVATSVALHGVQTVVGCTDGLSLSTWDAPPVRYDAGIERVNQLLNDDGSLVVVGGGGQGGWIFDFDTGETLFDATAEERPEVSHVRSFARSESEAMEVLVGDLGNVLSHEGGSWVPAETDLLSGSADRMLTTWNDQVFFVFSDGTSTVQFEAYGSNAEPYPYQSDGEQISLSSVYSDGEILVAVGKDHTTSQPLVYVFPDGPDSTPNVWDGADAEGTFTSACGNAERIVVVGSSGYGAGAYGVLWTSEDQGMSWMPGEDIFASGLTACDADADSWVVVSGSRDVYGSVGFAVGAPDAPF